MEQRRLRLGDILDDYCPRERRLTNHAVVAMIEEDVKQTRCTTCDTEHAYKGGKVPKRRKKDTPATLYKEVLAGQNPREEAHIVIDHDSDETDSQTAAPVDPERVVSAEPLLVSPEPTAENTIEPPVVAAESSEPVDAPTEIEEGPVHRRLIRAQLPRIEGQKEERRLPEFTVRQRGNGSFRGGDSRMKPHRQGGTGQPGNGGANGNRPQGGSRFAGQRSSSGGRGPAGRGGGQPGFRSGQRQGGGGRKRSR
jgi:hypothetical protein